MRDGRLIFNYWSDGKPLLIADIGRDAVSAAMGLGSGPGEVRLPRNVYRGLGDSIYVDDAILRRLNVLSPAGEFIRSFLIPIGFATDMIQLGNGRFVFSADLRTRESAGLPIHLLDGTGRFLKSFGSEERMVRILTSDDLYRLERRLAAGQDSTFWSVIPGTYVVEKWSAHGERLERHELAPQWFDAVGKSMSASIAEPPPTKVIDLQVDRAGRLWVLVLRPDSLWRQAVRPANRPPATMEVISMDGYVDTEIQVFDVRTMSPVASLRLDQALGGFVAPGVAVSSEATVNDEPVVLFWRMIIETQ